MNFNMQKLMKQAKEMQAKMKEAQEELETSTFVGEAGGKLVSVTIDGKYMIQDIKIDPKCVDPEDTEMLEDLIKVAYNNAANKLTEESNEKLGKVSPDLGGLM